MKRCEASIGVTARKCKGLKHPLNDLIGHVSTLGHYSDGEPEADSMVQLSHGNVRTACWAARIFLSCSPLRKHQPFERQLLNPYVHTTKGVRSILLLGQISVLEPIRRLAAVDDRLAHRRA